MFSKEFLIAIKLNTEPQYRLAHKAGINPNELSKWIRGIAYPHKDDKRIRRLANILGLSLENVFAENEMPI